MENDFSAFSQDEIDFNQYVDYTYLDGRTITLSSITAFVEGFRDEIEKESGKIEFIMYSEDDLKKDAFKLTNLLSEVGSRLTRGYAILRTVKLYKSKLENQWYELKNKELSDGIEGKTKDIREATLANKYKMVYTSIQILDGFIENEIIEYINELIVAKEILSRQISSLELELRLSGINNY